MAENTNNNGSFVKVLVTGDDGGVKRVPVPSSGATLGTVLESLGESANAWEIRLDNEKTSDLNRPVFPNQTVMLLREQRGNR